MQTTAFGKKIFNLKRRLSNEKNELSELNGEKAKFCPKCGMQQKGIRPHYSNLPIDEPVKTNIATIIGAILVLIALVFNAIAIFKTSAPLEYYAIWNLFSITGTTISLIGLFDCIKKDEKGKKLAISAIVIGSLSFLYDLREIIQFLIFLYN